MKAFAVILIILLLVAVVAVGIFFFSAKIDVRFVSCIATLQLALFSRLSRTGVQQHGVSVHLTDGVIDMRSSHVPVMADEDVIPHGARAHQQ